jgi:hypothetical protein
MITSGPDVPTMLSALDVPTIVGASPKQLRVAALANGRGSTSKHIAESNVNDLLI